MKPKFSADANFKMSGKIPTNNATQMAQRIVSGMTGKGAKYLNDSQKKSMGSALKTLAKGQKSTAKAAINTAGTTAVSLGTTFAGSQAYARTREAQAIEQQAANLKSYEEALQQWNSLISQRVADPYTEGDQGAVSGNKTTGSILGG